MKKQSITILLFLIICSALKAQDIEILMIDHNWAYGTGFATRVIDAADTLETEIGVSANVDYIQPAEGAIATALAAKEYDMIFYIGMTADTNGNPYPNQADINAISNFHDNKPYIIMDGVGWEIIAPVNAGLALSVNDRNQFVRNIITELDRLNGGLWIITDNASSSDNPDGTPISRYDRHSDFLVTSLGYHEFNMNSNWVEGNVQAPLPTHPIYADIVGLSGTNRSSAGEVPIGLQPNGKSMDGILFTQDPTPNDGVDDRIPLLSANFEPGITQPATCLNKLIASSDKSIVSAGEEFTVTLDLDIDPSVELYGAQPVIPYDENLLEIVSSSYTTGAGSFFDGSALLNITPIDSAGSWAGANSIRGDLTGLNGTGTLATITFRVKDTVTTAGDTTIGADDGSSFFSLKPTASNADISGGLCVEDACVEPVTVTIDAGSASVNAVLEKPIHLCDAPLAPHNLSGTTVTLVSQATGFTRTAITDAAGAFDFGSLPAGDYDLFAQGGNYILPCETITLVDATAADLGNKDMLAGDVDGNGAIEDADKTALEGNFLTANAGFDLNNDGAVNLFDLTILSSNIDKTIVCN